MKGGLAGIAIDQLTQRVDTEVDIAAAAHVEQLRAVRRRTGRGAGRVQGDQLTEQSPAALVLRHNLLEAAKLMMHARLARAGMHLPRKTHHVAGLEERLHEAQGAALEAVLDIGIESGGSSHREIQTQPERSAREKPQLADERRNDERRRQVAKTPVWAYRSVGMLALVRYICRGIPDEAAARPSWRSTAALHEAAVEPRIKWQFNKGG